MDRSPKVNFLATTVDSLRASGLLDHPDFELHIFHTGHRSTNLDQLDLTHASITLHTNQDPLHFNLGTVNLFRHAASQKPDFILFMEDDVHVCEDFPEFVVSALSEFEAGSVLDFLTYYEEVKTSYLEGARSIEMPAHTFYGTQCFAMRPLDALSFADFVEQHHGVKPGFADTWFDSWMEQTDRPRVVSCSVPSPAQHTGFDSTHDHQFINAPAFIRDVEKLVPVATEHYLLIDGKDEKPILKHKTRGTQLQLNESAHLIYLYCDGLMSIGQIIDTIRTQVPMDRVVLSAQMRQAIASLRHNQVIEIKKVPA